MLKLPSSIALSLLSVFFTFAVDAPAGNILLVDKRGGTPYADLRSATMVAKPGDTIKIAPGSGPYRESLLLKTSGEPGSPITVDGSGETVTGFEPLQGFQKSGDTYVCDLKPLYEQIKTIQGFIKKDGKWVCNNPRVTLPVFPGVISYKGERVLQDAGTGQFTKYATFSAEEGTLTLLPGVEPEGWEVARKGVVVGVYNVSHHIYRNLRASGSLNDGFNLHGKGEDLVFENIEGFQNIDEGFSSHDEMHCEIRNGLFWENDNGIAQHAPLKATDVKCFSNLGWGMAFGAAQLDFTNVQCWNNGVGQIYLHEKSVAVCHNVKVFETTWKSKPWVNYQESSSKASQPAFVDEDALAQGDPVEIAPADDIPKEIPHLTYADSPQQ